MSLQDISAWIIAFAGTFSIWLALAIFIMLVVNEFGPSLPYVMETIWILSGYHAAAGDLPVYQLLILWLVAVAGRSTGATVFYFLAGLGRGPVFRVYRRFFPESLSEQTGKTISLPARVVRRINLLSPFSVTLGRMIWLRVPLTIALSMLKRLKTLLEAVALHSFVWDGTYITIGIIGGNVRLQPTTVLLYSLAGLTVVYLLSFLVRRFSRPPRRTN